jgi:hypothetical protein
MHGYLCGSEKGNEKLEMAIYSTNLHGNIGLWKQLFYFSYFFLMQETLVFLAFLASLSFIFRSLKKQWKSKKCDSCSTIQYNETTPKTPKR